MNYTVRKKSSQKLEENLDFEGSKYFFPVLLIKSLHAFVFFKIYYFLEEEIDLSQKIRCVLTAGLCGCSGSSV